MLVYNAQSSRCKAKPTSKMRCYACNLNTKQILRRTHSYDIVSRNTIKGINSKIFLCFSMRSILQEDPNQHQFHTFDCSLSRIMKIFEGYIGSKYSRTHKEWGYTTTVTSHKRSRHITTTIPRRGLRYTKTLASSETKFAKVNTVFEE